MTAVTKGYQLDRLFRIARTITLQMARIFAEHNMNGYLDVIRLNKVNPEAAKQWQALHDKHCRVAELIVKIVLSK